MPHLFVVPPRRRNNLPKNVALPIFSDADADLRAVVWTLTTWGYAMTTRMVNGIHLCIASHRVVLSRMLGRELADGEMVDHINRKRLDNTRSNLRLVTNHQNLQNQGRQVNNTSGYRGVSWDKHREKWMAKVQVLGKTINGGRFDDIQLAAARATQMRKDYGFLDSSTSA